MHSRLRHCVPWLCAMCMASRKSKRLLDDIKADVCISPHPLVPPLPSILSPSRIHFHSLLKSNAYKKHVNLRACEMVHICVSKYGYAMGPQHIQMGRKTKTKPTNEENNNKNGDIKWEKRLPMQNIDCTQFTWQHAIQGCYLRLDHSMNNQRQHSITAASPNTTVSKSSGQYKKRADDKSEIWPLRI